MLRFFNCFYYFWCSSISNRTSFFTKLKYFKNNCGIIIIIFSLQLIGIFNFSFLNYEKRFEAKKTNNIYFPYLIGLAFGFGWTPCIGPILGSILTLAAIEETLSKAIILLSLYSIGLAYHFFIWAS